MHGLRNHFKRVLGGRLFFQANNVYVTQTPKQQLEIGSPLPDSSLPLKLGGVLFVYLVGGLVAMENMRMDSDPTDRWQQISQASLFKLAPLSQFVLSLICPRSKYDNALISLSSTMDQIDAAMRKSPQANPAIPHFLDDALFDILSCMWVWNQAKTEGEIKYTITGPRYGMSDATNFACKRMFQLFKNESGDTWTQTQLRMSPDQYMRYKDLLHYEVKLELFRLHPFQYSDWYDQNGPVRFSTSIPAKVYEASVWYALQIASLALFFPPPLLADVLVKFFHIIHRLELLSRITAVKIVKTDNKIDAVKFREDVIKSFSRARFWGLFFGNFALNVWAVYIGRNDYCRNMAAMSSDNFGPYRNDRGNYDK
jgi:hypothetical protein